MTTQTHRDQVDAVIHQYGDADRLDLPDYLRNPTNEHEFALSLALLMHHKRQSEGFTGGPVYDDAGFLTGFSGIKLKR